MDPAAPRTHRSRVMRGEKGQVRIQVRHDDRNPARGRNCGGDRRSHAEFFSFGTNDLTQMTFGYSRDDAERNFLVTYVEEGILPRRIHSRHLTAKVWAS